MYVIKRNGTLEKFDPQKIIRTCLRAGVDEKTAVEIEREVEDEIYNRISSEELYKIVMQKLRRIERSHAYLYRLKEAVAEIQPFAFEKYTKIILESIGYDATWNVIIQGKCVDHQVDVVAKKSGKMFLVECKRHVNPHRFCGLGVGLQVQARLEDIMDGYKSRVNNYKFDQAWIFTNTKFSEHIIKYANAKRIILTGWNYPSGKGLQYLCQKKQTLPVTLLPISSKIKAKLQEKDIITLMDFISSGKRKLMSAGLDAGRIDSLRRTAAKIMLESEK